MTIYLPSSFLTANPAIVPYRLVWSCWSWAPFGANVGWISRKYRGSVADLENWHAVNNQLSDRHARMDSRHAAAWSSSGKKRQTRISSPKEKGLIKWTASAAPSFFQWTLKISCSLESCGYFLKYQVNYQRWNAGEMQVFLQKNILQSRPQAFLNTSRNHWGGVGLGHQKGWLRHGPSRRAEGMLNVAKTTINKTYPYFRNLLLPLFTCKSAKKGNCRHLIVG